MSIGTGTKLGPYEVQDFIGQGAMGLVYRAYHAQLARTGAVKVMQAIAPDGDSIARFRREAQAIAQMRHPNILNVYDFGEHEGMPYMIVEYVPGGSLANRLSQGPLDQAAALKYLRGIAAGLDHAHGLGIIHRDVKPANVLLEKDDTPVLADFGLAKLLKSSSVKSMTGVTTGTPAYMSPEQVTGSQVGPPADRYSLATIAYEMLTGSIPFDGEGLMEVLYAQVHRDPPLPSARNGALNQQVDAVVMRGLAKDPAARWESCTAFVDALALALAEKAEPALAKTRAMTPAVDSTVPLAQLAPVGAVPAGLPAAWPEVTVAVAYPTPTPPVPKRKSRKRLWIIVSAALVVLLILALGVCAAANQKPTLSLSPSTVLAGDSVVVRATHVPANQTGEIHLQSQLHVFPFRAGGNGDVSVDITVPRDVGIGNHLVSICWNGTCRAQVTLHVIEPLASGSPPASPTPSTATPSPTPRLTPSPSSPTRALALSSGHIKVATGTMTVRGSSFSPGKTVTLTFIQGAITKNVAEAVVGTDGTFLQSYTIPAAAAVGPAYIRVCDVNGCAYASITVTST